MNREIKFRGKPCYKGVKTWPWIYGTFQYIAQRLVNPGGTDNGTLVPRVDKGRIVDLYGNKTEVLCDTVGQFTGLYDKNGKEIYEGDILKVECTDGSSIYKIVRFVPEKAAFCMANTFEIKDEGRWDIWSYVSQRGIKEIEVSVIGNIHDNPELSKQ